MGRSRYSDASAHLAAIVASSDDAIVSKSLDGIVQTWNRGAERMFGYSAEEVVGRSIVIIIPEERLAEEAEVLRKIRAGETVDHFETVRQAKDGHLLDVSLTVSPIRNASGRLIGASKIARDITEQKRLRLEAEQASRLKDEFLATLSHELRTPLNTVLGYAALLRDGVLDGDQRAKAAGVILRNAEVLWHLVDDLLDTSRIVSGKMSLRMAPCDLSVIAREAVESVRHAFEARGIRLDARFADRAPLTADPDRVRQIVWNLLSNAVKFTPAGGTVTMRVEAANTHARLVVRDTGIGIAPEWMPYIFQRFWQMESTHLREHGGLGLGLALSRHLAELHGGTILVESAGLGAGAQFTVELPLASSAPDLPATLPAAVPPGIDEALATEDVPAPPKAGDNTAPADRARKRSRGPVV